MDTKISWFGIDFGTTNSAAFSFTGLSAQKARQIHYGDDEGRPFPSIVAINKEDGSVITGREAKDRRNELSQSYRYFTSIKSIIDSNESWKIGGKLWTPETVAAEIFKALIERVKRDGGSNLDEAVVAVPNGFSPIKKQHLRNAAALAGLRISAFIGEPTAAFCSNSNELRECNTVAVFDWGGGTLDVTVLSVRDGKIQELATDGMNWAGNDIDLKLAEKIHTKIARKNGAAIPFAEMDPASKDRMLTACEAAKIELEDEDTAYIRVNKYADFGTVREALDYDFFDLLIEEDIQNAINCLDAALKKAGQNAVTIDRILCVGGSSKLRPLREKLTEIYGEDMLYYPDEVMWDIARGAAVSSSHANTFCSNQSLGLLLSNGEYFPLLSEGQPIPCEESEYSFAIVDNSSNATFVITDSALPQKRSFSESITLKARGFLEEHFIVKCYVDQDFVFKMRINSSSSYPDKFLVWSYSNLKVYWDIN